MTSSPFDPRFDELPRIIPVFPLPGALLMPGGRLPLNIFEPRYLAMVRDALASGRIIGMIQPRDTDDRFGAPELYQTGCAGRIISFSETPDGRYMITLAGTCRFDMAEELPEKDGYRRIVAEYRRYRADMEMSAPLDIDRKRLIGALRRFFDGRQIKADWDAIEKTPDERLVVSLAMMCPFQPPEKQALLEAPDLAACSEMMITLLEMARLESDDADPTTTN